MSPSRFLSTFVCNLNLRRNFRTMLPLLQKSNEDIHKWLKKFDTFLFDCDGVLWIENEAITGSVDVVNRLKELGKRVLFVTNNSTKQRKDFVVKAHKLGFKVEADDIVSTAFLASVYLKELNFNKKVYLVGSPGLAGELRDVGIESIGVGPDNLETTLSNVVDNFKVDPEVGAVVVGFDEHFNYVKMLKAASYLNNPDILFIATNTDERFPMSSTLVCPGTGAVLSGIVTCSLRQPVILGKPNTYIAEALTKTFGVKPERTVMVGDRCNTDIALGSRCGFGTLLVMTGVTTLKDLEEYQASKDPEKKEMVPHEYCDKLGDILPYLE